jgi:hypothetical protein
LIDRGPRIIASVAACPSARVRFCSKSEHSPIECYEYRLDKCLLSASSAYAGYEARHDGRVTHRPATGIDLGYEVTDDAAEQVGRFEIDVVPTRLSRQKTWKDVAEEAGVAEPGTEFFAAETGGRIGLIRLDCASRDRTRKENWQTCL